MDTHQILKQKGLCCISRKPLTTSKYINFVTLPFRPTWSFPIEKNFLIKDYPDHALAIVHDDFINEDGNAVGEVLYAIELAGEEIIYHPITELEAIDAGLPKDPEDRQQQSIDFFDWNFMQNDEEGEDNYDPGEEFDPAD